MQISVLLSRHELCRIYALFWSDFDADFYADIGDFVQILCRFLHEKMLVGTSATEAVYEHLMLKTRPLEPLGEPCHSITAQISESIQHPTMINRNKQTG